MDPNEKWPELSAMLGELGSKLDRLIDAGMENALPDYADGIVLSATAQTVQLHEGYRYNYLVVSSDAATAMGSSNTLTIDTPGIKYTQPIYEGINPLNIKGSSAKLSVSGLSGQYVAQFVETNESPLVMSAGVVKLTGSLVPEQKELVLENYSQTLNLAANTGILSIVVTPPAGQLWRVVSMYANLPYPSGDTGDNSVAIYSGSLQILSVAGSNTSGLGFNGAGLIFASAGITPNNYAGFLHSLQATASTPLTFEFEETSTVANTGNLIFYILWEVTSIDTIAN